MKIKQLRKLIDNMDDNDELLFEDGGEEFAYPVVKSVTNKQHGKRIGALIITYDISSSKYGDPIDLNVIK